MNESILSPGLQAAERARTTVIVAMAGALYFTIAIVVLHFLRPDLNPISRLTSEYAVGQYGLIMSTAFFSMSLATVALLIGLYRIVPPAARSPIGLGLLGLWAVGVLIAMLFPIDAQGAPPTVAGTIHSTSGPLAFLSVTIGVLLVSGRFKRDTRWRPFHRIALMLSLVLLVGYIATFLSFVTQSGYLGITQRITLAALVTWMLLTAARLRSLSIESI
jgi:hypothetical protein